MEQTGYETQPVSLLGFLFSISFCSSLALTMHKMYVKSQTASSCKRLQAFDWRRVDPG